MSKNIQRFLKSQMRKAITSNNIKFSLQEYHRAIENIYNLHRDGNIRLKYPLELYFELTNDCNLKCAYCYIGKKEKIYMKKYDFLKVIKDIAFIKDLLIVFEGGEPFLHPEINEFIKVVKDNNLALFIITNGTLINYNNARYLAKLFTPNDCLQITLDGHNESIHNITRGHTFKQVIKSIKMLLNMDIPVVINTVVTIHNYKFLPQIYKFVLDLGVKEGITFTPVFPLGDNSSRKYTPPTDMNEWDEIVSKLLEVEEPSQLPILGFPIYPWKVLQFSTLNKSSGEQSRFFRCKGGRTKLSVDVSGDIYPCILLKSSRFKMGNITHNSIIEIWNSGLAKKTVQKISELQSYCAECKFVRICGGMCPAYILNGEQCPAIMQ